MLDCCAARPCCFSDFAQQWRDSFSLGRSWLRALKGESVPYSVLQRECSDFHVLHLPEAFLSQGSRSQLPSSPVALLSLLACVVPREKAVVSTLLACAARASLCLQSCSPSLAVFLSFPADPSHTLTGFAGGPKLARGTGGHGGGYWNPGSPSLRCCSTWDGKGYFHSYQAKCERVGFGKRTFLCCFTGDCVLGVGISGFSEEPGVEVVVWPMASLPVPALAPSQAWSLSPAHSPSSKWCSPPFGSQTHRPLS